MPVCLVLRDSTTTHLSNDGEATTLLPRRRVVFRQISLLLSGNHRSCSSRVTIFRPLLRHAPLGFTNLTRAACGLSKDGGAWRDGFVGRPRSEKIIGGGGKPANVDISFPFSCEDERRI